MKPGQLQRQGSIFGDKGHAFLAAIIIAAMLGVMYVPIFVVFFFSVFAFFVYKSLAGNNRNLTHEIFEFYLTANEMLRDDERRWFGFEIRDAIGRGESIVERMSTAPPLLRFAIGALYNKIGEHKSAISYLASAVEQSSGDELKIVYPTSELRDYVRVLRKIERSPAEAPLTSASVRSLERIRRFRGAVLLEESRKAFATYEPKPIEDSDRIADKLLQQSAVESRLMGEEPPPVVTVEVLKTDVRSAESGVKNCSAVEPSADEKPFGSRKPITEVLHDIYDSQASR
ncbi:MAG: hypothetical protein C4324_06030 [Blastocatellia bacterium]